MYCYTLLLYRHRNSQVRKMTSKYICAVVENYDPTKFLHSSKDLLDKALPAIIQLIKDGSPDARYYARRSLNVLWPEPDFFQVAAKVLRSNLLSDIKEAVETLKMKVCLLKQRQWLHSLCYNSVVGSG